MNGRRGGEGAIFLSGAACESKLPYHTRDIDWWRWHETTGPLIFTHVGHEKKEAVVHEIIAWIIYKRSASKTNFQRVLGRYHCSAAMKPHEFVCLPGAGGSSRPPIACSGVSGFTSGAPNWLSTQTAPPDNWTHRGCSNFKRKKHKGPTK